MVNPHIDRETSKLARQTKNIEILFKKSQALTLEHDSALKDLNFYESVKLIFCENLPEQGNFCICFRFGRPECLDFGSSDR